MGRFSIVHPLYMSFYSRPLYRDVAVNWRGTVFVYLFLVLALCWIPVAGVVKSMVSSYIAYEAPKIVSQIPEIRISGGKATVDAEMPYTIKDAESGKPLAILDTTGKTTSLDGSEAFALLTADSIILKRSDAETRTYKLTDASDIVINQTEVKHWLDEFDYWFVFFMYPSMLFLSYIYRLLQALFFAFVGKMYNRSLGAGLDYQALLRISVIALTPCIILNTLFLVSKSVFPAWGLVCFFISLAYLYFGIMANVRENPAGGDAE